MCDGKCVGVCVSLCDCSSGSGKTVGNSHWKHKGPRGGGGGGGGRSVIKMVVIIKFIKPLVLSLSQG